MIFFLSLLNKRFKINKFKDGYGIIESRYRYNIKRIRFFFVQLEHSEKLIISESQEI